jgi:hypothetical protein
MPITTLHEETSIDDLIGGIYARLKPAERKRVVAAIIKANPHLEGQDRLAAGTVLTIPTVAGVRLDPADAAEGLEDPVGAGNAWVVQRVKDYGEHLTQRHDLYQSQLKQQSELLNDQSFKEALRGRQDAAQLVPEIEAAIKARSKEASLLRRESEDALAKLVEALGSLQGTQ